MKKYYLSLFVLALGIATYAYAQQTIKASKIVASGTDLELEQKGAGNIKITDGSEGTAGECLVSTDTSGSLNWDTCPGGGGDLQAAFDEDPTADPQINFGANAFNFDGTGSVQYGDFSSPRIGGFVAWAAGTINLTTSTGNWIAETDSGQVRITSDGSGASDQVIIRADGSPDNAIDITTGNGGTTFNSSVNFANFDVELSSETANPSCSGHEGAVFYNDTSNYLCFCDGTATSKQVHSPATNCF